MRIALPARQTMQHSERHAPEAGFTLIEILAVLALIGILVTLAGPRVDLAHYRLTGAMSDVGSRLFVAQRTALQTQHDVVVAIDADESRMRVHQDLNRNHRVDEGEPAVWEEIPEGIRFGRGAAGAMAGYTDDVSFDARQDGYPAVTFYRNGSASE